MPHQRTTTIQDAFDLYLLDNQARGLAQSTLSSYRAKLPIFTRWCEAQGIESLHALSSVDMRRFLVYLQEQQFSNRYYINIAKVVQTFLNYCVQDELIEASPLDKVKLPKLDKRILPAFSAAEIKQILKACNNLRDQLICYVLLDSGLRASELLALNGKDIDEKTGVVAVHKGKGAKDRTTYIGAKTRKLLRRFYDQYDRPRPTEPIFRSLTSGDRLTLFGLAQMMERLRITSGVQSCSCHTFRRTFALTCLRNGMNIYVLARLMGHADISILKPYLDLVSTDLQAAHQEFGVVDHL